MEVIDKTALVFGWGDTIYVNRPRNAELLDSDDVLVHKSSQSEWCRLDIVQAMARPGMWFRGTVDLGVPFTALIALDFPTYAPDELPPHLQAIPAIKPGSRAQA